MVESVEVGEVVVDVGAIPAGIWKGSRPVKLITGEPVLVGPCVGVPVGSPGPTLIGGSAVPPVSFPPPRTTFSSR